MAKPSKPNDDQPNLPGVEKEPEKPTKVPGEVSVPRYMQSPAAIVAHIEYVLSESDQGDCERILQFVIDGLPKRFPRLAARRELAEQAEQALRSALNKPPSAQ